MIPWQVIQQALADRGAEPTVDQQFRCNHEGCTAGEDTRQRLYIKRSSTTTYIAYCHNCGQPGIYKKGHALSNRIGNRDVFSELALVFGYDSLDEAPALHEEEYHPAGSSVELAPADAVHDWSKVPKWVIDWLVPHKIFGTSHMKELQWTYSPGRDSIVMPLRMDPESCAFGHQERFAPGTLPKTLTTYAEHAPKIGYAAFRKSESSLEKVKTIVIVEDPLSASLVTYAKSEYLGYALLGTHLSNHKKGHLIDIIRMCPELKRIVVWTDNDPAGEAAKVPLAVELRGICMTPIFLTPYGMKPPNKIGGQDKIIEELKLINGE